MKIFRFYFLILVLSGAATQVMYPSVPQPQPQPQQGLDTNVHAGIEGYLAADDKYVQAATDLYVKWLRGRIYNAVHKVLKDGKYTQVVKGVRFAKDDVYKKAATFVSAAVLRELALTGGTQRMVNYAALVEQFVTAQPNEKQLLPQKVWELLLNTNVSPQVAREVAMHESLFRLYAPGIVSEKNTLLANFPSGRQKYVGNLIDALEAGSKKSLVRQVSDWAAEFEGARQDDDLESMFTYMRGAEDALEKGARRLSPDVLEQRKKELHAMELAFYSDDGPLKKELAAIRRLPTFKAARRFLKNPQQQARDAEVKKLRELYELAHKAAVSPDISWWDTFKSLWNGIKGLPGINWFTATREEVEKVARKEYEPKAEERMQAYAEQFVNVCVALLEHGIEPESVFIADPEHKPSSSADDVVKAFEARKPAMKLVRDVLLQLWQGFSEDARVRWPGFVDLGQSLETIFTLIKDPQNQNKPKFKKGLIDYVEWYVGELLAPVARVYNLPDEDLKNKAEKEAKELVDREPRFKKIEFEADERKRVELIDSRERALKRHTKRLLGRFMNLKAIATNKKKKEGEISQRANRYTPKILKAANAFEPFIKKEESWKSAVSMTNLAQALARLSR